MSLFMRGSLVAVGLAAFGGAVLLTAQSPSPSRAGPAPAPASDGFPTVVELFQSQGCSSCPPANANLNAIAGRGDVIALSFAVTYWDRLGWTDTFANPAFTQRQWDYANAAGRGNVATPQVIVNGREAIVGNRREELDARIAAHARDSGPDLGFRNGRLSVGRAPASRPATVWLVRYDPRTHEVPIRAGENGGRTLPHRNIVRALSQLGQWTGAPAGFAVPASPNPAWRSAVIVQRGTGGPIIAARRI